jgi:ubiquinone/menaquinone biosynthesis C-methylase UbiE
MPRPEVPDGAPDQRRVAVGARAAYDAIARDYHDQLGNELSGKPLDRALLEAFTELAGAGTIADVGCGPGHVTRFLAGRHAEVIGIDLSPGMIGLAREHAPTLAFAVGSMLQLPVADSAWSARPTRASSTRG